MKSKERKGEEREERAGGGERGGDGGTEEKRDENKGKEEGKMKWKEERENKKGEERGRARKGPREHAFQQTNFMCKLPSFFYYSDTGRAGDTMVWRIDQQYSEVIRGYFTEEILGEYHARARVHFSAKSIMRVNYFSSGYFD